MDKRGDYYLERCSRLASQSPDKTPPIPSGCCAEGGNQLFWVCHLRPCPSDHGFPADPLRASPPGQPDALRSAGRLAGCVWWGSRKDRTRELAALLEASPTPISRPTWVVLGRSLTLSELHKSKRLRETREKVPLANTLMGSNCWRWECLANTTTCQQSLRGMGQGWARPSPCWPRVQPQSWKVLEGGKLWAGLY